MVTPSTGTTPHIAETYDIGLIIPHHALIGRDILRKCVLSYNGDRGWYTLAY